MDLVLLAARLVLALVFAVAGLTKLMDRVGSQRAFVDFGVPARLAPSLAVVLPLAELAIAAAQPTSARHLVPTLEGITRNPRDAAAGQRRHARQVALHDQIHALHANQVAVASIARQLGVGRQTVYRYLRRTAPPERTRAGRAAPRAGALYGVCGAALE